MYNNLENVFFLAITKVLTFWTGFAIRLYISVIIIFNNVIL